VKIEPENQTLASITFQNYFRMYPEAVGNDRHGDDRGAGILRHLQDERGRDPDQRPVQRIDEDDEFYKNMTDKFAAIAKEIKAKQEIGQPVLVGTVSIEKSEMLSEFLERKASALGPQRPLPRERGAYRRPGRPLGAVTIATNMAGRGTDIQLGGNLEFRMRGRISETCSPATPEYEAQASGSAEVAERKGGCSKPAACSCSAPSGTRAAASTTSCAAAPAARATRACRASTSASTTTCCASSVRRRCSRG
jgi:preprotein translocase subunit SecA